MLMLWYQLIRPCLWVYFIHVLILSDLMDFACNADKAGEAFISAQ